MLAGAEVMAAKLEVVMDPAVNGKKALRVVCGSLMTHRWREPRLPRNPAPTQSLIIRWRVSTTGVGGDRSLPQYKADRIVAEVNNGGDMVEATLRMVDPNVPFTAVHASRGKVTRAEPVAALYEQGRVHHRGAFPELEDQMCGFTTNFERQRASFSPDRVDALWAPTDLLVEPMSNWGIYEFYRRAAAECTAARMSTPSRPEPTYAPGTLEYAAQQRAKNM
jgi:terminase large subunit-like protein